MSKLVAMGFCELVLSLGIYKLVSGQKGSFLLVNVLFYFCHFVCKSFRTEM